ncbi:uncharacterized protein LOC135936630 [Cloeon dipterum]|uniref:uncharacterized protein LOC135936630 n=1 Tax=Cloeon dipterum TaxID=197152 RepID=UPI003220128F
MQQESETMEGLADSVTIDMSAPERDPLALDFVHNSPSCDPLHDSITEVVVGLGQGRESVREETTAQSPTRPDAAVPPQTKRRLFQDKKPSEEEGQEQESEQSDEYSGSEYVQEEEDSQSGASTSSHTDSERQKRPLQPPPASDSPEMADARMEPAEDDELAAQVAALRTRNAALAAAKLELVQRVASLEAKKARLMEENQTLRDEAAVNDQRVAHLKKARREFKHQNLETVHSLQQAVAEPGTSKHTEATYWTNMNAVGQRLSEHGWQKVLLNDPNLPKKVPSCVTSKKGNIGIEQDDIDECYEDGSGSLYSVMRHVAINLFRIENLLYFSYGGTRSTRRQKATMALPKELKNEFLDLAGKIIANTKYKWYIRSKEVTIKEIDIKRIAKKALINLMTERRPKFKPTKEDTSSSESEDDSD